MHVVRIFFFFYRQTNEDHHVNHFQGSKQRIFFCPSYVICFIFVPSYFYILGKSTSYLSAINSLLTLSDTRIFQEMAQQKMKKKKDNKNLDHTHLSSTKEKELNRSAIIPSLIRDIGFEL